jgi:hypothetical protein
MEKIYWLAEFLEQMENKLAPAEQEYANAMLSIAARYGKLADGDENGIWVGYEEQEDNENYTIGVKCSNCYFFESDTVCQIVARPIEPGGYCRLAAIPPGLVKAGSKDD